MSERLKDILLGAGVVVCLGLATLIGYGIGRKRAQKSVLVVATNALAIHPENTCFSVVCKFSSRETRPTRDKNGTKPQENKVDERSVPNVGSPDPCSIRKGTLLSRNRQRFPPQTAIRQRERENPLYHGR